MRSSPAAPVKRKFSSRLPAASGALSQRPFPVLGEIPQQRSNHRLASLLREPRQGCLIDSRLWGGG